MDNKKRKENFGNMVLNFKKNFDYIKERAEEKQKELDKHQNY